MRKEDLEDRVTFILDNAEIPEPIEQWQVFGETFDSQEQAWVYAKYQALKNDPEFRDDPYLLDAAMAELFRREIYQ
jgi:hypothetical protein